MALQAGTRLGPYEILEPLGAGGMGEVYRARDTRLDRTVAIKVLPDDVAADSQLKARFEREARAISALSHPNICTLHDVGEEDGQTFLVMEHLVGQTLAERLKKGSLPLQQSLEVATQIADALAAAHKQGIVHRDLKPSNVMLTKTGARLLDFGLARLTGHGERPAVNGMSSAPTEQAPLTGQGTILGTLPYMAPEQVEGQSADPRTDLWALGTILYEMIAGGRAFEGSTPPSLVAAILEREPAPLAERQPLTPRSLERLVRRCLAKDPDERWDTAHDVAVRLREIAGPDADSGEEDRRARGGRLRMLRALGGLFAAFAAGAASLWLSGSFLSPLSPPQSVKRLTVTLPQDAPLDTRFFLQALALSRDGQRLAYVASIGQHDDDTQLYLRMMDQNEVIAIPNTVGAKGPFFSPDGAALAFFAENKLKTVVLPRGEVSDVADAPNPFGGSWGPDGSIVFAPTASSGLLRVSAEGGAPEVLTRLDSTNQHGAHSHPEVMPDGRAILFTVEKDGRHHIEVLSLDSGERRILVRGGIGPKYVPTGHLVYRTKGRLEAVPFDPERLQVTGSATTVLNDLSATPISTDVANAPNLSFARDGSLAYVPNVSYPFGRRLAWVDRGGESKRFGAPARAYWGVRLSPDGRQVAAQIVGPNDDIWVYEVTRRTLTRLTFEGENWGPLWTPDGQRIVFTSAREGPPNLFWLPADGSGPPARLATSEQPQWPTSCSPDGRVLAFTEVDPVTGADLWLLNLEGKDKPRPFLKTPFDEDEAAFSPDGKWLAYASDESGRYEVYVQPFPAPGGKRQVSTEGGRKPLWAASGREMFYVEGRKLMAARVQTEPTFSSTTPTPLFEGHSQDVRWFELYDAAADGQRFLMVERHEQELGRPQFNFVVNWFEELKAKMREAEQ